MSLIYPKLQILILDDEFRVREELFDFLSTMNFELFEAENFAVAQEIFISKSIDVLILDIKLVNINGLLVLEWVKQNYPNTEVIMISGHGDMNVVIDCLRKGASDFLSKPFSFRDLNLAIERTRKFIFLNKQLKETENSYQFLLKELQDRDQQMMIAESPQMKNIIHLMELVAKTENTTVLITGDTGTGKELVAKGIHYLSNRSKHIFHPVNCTTIPENLFESEFFGYQKGAFTDAKESKAGWFEISNKGTLFLDEIGDLPMPLQGKLLRVLEDKQIIRLGDRKSLKVNVRIIAATNQDISSGAKFRSDLYHRLSIFIIHIPPLCERKEDIIPLFNHFLQLFSRQIQKKIVNVDPEIEKIILSHNFSGNVRELKNMVERAVILSKGDKLTKTAFIESIKINSIEKQDNSMEEFDLEKIEINAITKALQVSLKNRSQAAKLLNISWQALERRILKYKIDI